MTGKMAEEEMSQCFPVLYLKVRLTTLREAEGVGQGGSLRVQVWAG